ncbi:MAG: hypothetical protein GC201_03990 [Alphaproteobacteria bacterium]|nr:hypothetical protein [Alphaproteobacteria bacterium]
MTRIRNLFIAAAFALTGAAAAHAGDANMTKEAGPYEVALHVLPAEPFHTQAEVDSGKATKGMLAVAGADPVQPDAANHHLIVHVSDKGTDKPVTDATVMMTYERVGENGEMTGTPQDVPVVNMQVIGKGAASTHYGNNVTMSPGHYSVSVVVNGYPATFDVSI